MEYEKVGFLFVWSMEIHMSRVRIWITSTSLTIDMYISSEGQDTINLFNHGNVYDKRGFWIPLNSLTMDIYMSREVQDPIKQFNPHTLLYLF
jgi:hypothetical protein